ncbi:MAG TPA: hypothetical protein VJT74_07650 [Pyrinomonadaceae bacterium]|nr:hypothetical protein [Pyrinomonadaceae bacterium]
MRPFVALSFALIVPFLLARDAAGQTSSASVTVSGHVSPAVFLTLTPGAQLSTDNFQVTSTQQDARTLRLTISTAGTEATRVRLPLQLRSNAASELSASTQSGGAELIALAVKDARATGSFVAPEALAAATDEARAAHSTAKQTLLTLPRISLAGTHDSPSNALEVTLLLEIQPGQNAVIELTLTASPVQVN